MRNIRPAAVVIGLLTMIPAFCLAEPDIPPSSRAADGRASANQGAMHATKGVVKFVDAHTRVISRSPRA